MKRSALVLSAAVVAIACAARAAPAEPQPQPQPAPPAKAATASCNGQSFLDKVYILKSSAAAPFRPDIYLPFYKPPEDVGQIDPQSSIATDLQAAFDIAPPFFRDKLCGLTRVYINPTGCANGDAYHCSLSDKQALDNSWGYRERQDQVRQPPYGEYIATSAGLWNRGSRAPTLAAFETKLLQNLLRWDAAAYASANPNTSAMAVLAALAHEYGHVLWYDTYNPNHIPDFFNEPADFCSVSTFFKGQWKHLGSQDLQPPKWRGFRASQNERPGDDATVGDPQAPQPGTLLYDAQMHDAGKTSQKMRKIFKSPGRWPSLFAAFAPDEDFVETFKFYTLLQLDRNDKPTNLQSLVIQMPDGTTADVPSDYANAGPGSRRDLHRKMHCFSRLFPPP